MASRSRVMPGRCCSRPPRSDWPVVDRASRAFAVDSSGAMPRVSGGWLFPIRARRAVGLRCHAGAVLRPPCAHPRGAWARRREALSLACRPPPLHHAHPRGLFDIGGVHGGQLEIGGERVREQLAHSRRVAFPDRVEFRDVGAVLVEGVPALLHNAPAAASSERAENVDWFMSSAPSGDRGSGDCAQNPLLMKTSRAQRRRRLSIGVAEDLVCGGGRVGRAWGPRGERPPQPTARASLTPRSAAGSRC
jgi:hypothetical protein